MKNEDFGYNRHFEENRIKLGFGDFPVARVIAEFKGLYRVINSDGEFSAKVTGKQIFEASGREDYPAVGDWVSITELDNQTAVIRGILPRATTIKRVYRRDTQIIASNVDVAFIVESVDRDYNMNRFERYFAIAENGGVKPAIVLAKIDLIGREELNAKFAELKHRFPGIDAVMTSTVDNKGLDELKSYIIKGKTYSFLGSSGVGKSSLINKLLGESAIKTGDISSYSGRGKHVTTGRQMYFLENGGIVIDNPGMREVGVAHAGQGIETLFDELTSLSQKCQYTDCTHVHEPGCAVLQAVSLGKLDKDKYSNYINLKKESDYYEMSSAERKEKDKRFGKFKKNALKGLKGLKYKDY